MGIDRENGGNASFLFEKQRSNIYRDFPVMIKPVGPICNLDCDYCYYLEKDILYPSNTPNIASFKMPQEVLEKLIQDYIASQQNRIEFIWHGGEPTILGLDYFKEIVRLQKKYASGKEIHNTLQTNGTLIDDKWAEFLAEHNFLCGISIDGPQKLHDKHRRSFSGEGSFEKIMQCIERFHRYGVEFNTMTVVNSSNSKQPAIVYEFLKSIGSKYMQFTPIAERIAEDENEPLSIVHNEYNRRANFMLENVSPEDWGNFLCRIFDLWVKNDVGTYFINYFDNTLAAYVNQPPNLCSMAPYCGCVPAIEHNGDTYCCDHFVFPEFKTGNLLDTSITELIKSDKQLFFEQRKQDTLAEQCKNCTFLSICGGDCPKNRFIRNQENQSISYLCKGFKMFFSHTRKYFEYMANELNHQRPPANVMKAKI